jgi:hypothetical protein
VTQPPPQQDQQVQQVAALLATYVAADLTADAIAKLVGLPASAVLAAVHLANRGTRPVPRAPGTGLATRQAQLEELYYRAAYILAASRRIARSLAAGSSLEEAVAAEKTYQAAHESARKARLAAAAEIDNAARAYGEPTADGAAHWLGWYLSGTVDAHTAACEHADGRNFRTDRRPRIGWPGTVHYGCRCYAGPPYPTAVTVDQATASFIRLGGKP